MATKNTLNQQDFFTAATWAKENKDKLTGLLRTQVAEEITKATGLEVTIHNVVSIGRTVGLTFREKRGAALDHSAALVILRDDMTFLAEMVRKCMVERGQAVPPRLEKLAAVV